MAVLRFLSFGCVHAPITHPGYWAWLMKQIEDVKPDFIINHGDWYEGLAGARHKRDPRHNWSLWDEHKAVEKQALEINALAPNSKRIWISGNHDDNTFGIHADRIPSDLRQAIQWRNHDGVREALRDWLIKDRYKSGTRWFLGQVSFGHGCPVTEASGKDEAYLYGVPYGLDIRSHTHRPEPVTQARERKSPLPYWYANTGTGADWEKMHYMDRQSVALWGRGCVVGEVRCAGEGREVKASVQWSAETRVHSWACPHRKNESDLRPEF